MSRSAHAELWHPIPTPSLRVPFVDVDQAVLLKLYRKAYTDERLPRTRPGSPQDANLARNLVCTTFDIRRRGLFACTSARMLPDSLLRAEL